MSRSLSSQPLPDEAPDELHRLEARLPYLFRTKGVLLDLGTFGRFTSPEACLMRLQSMTDERRAACAALLTQILDERQIPDETSALRSSPRSARAVGGAWRTWR